MKVVTIIGARPQFIKASVVSDEFFRRGVSEIVVNTGQHYDPNMSSVFFSELGMRQPAYNLGIGGGKHGEMTGRMLAEIEKVLLEEVPEVVLVYGDTNSTLAGALAAVKLHIQVAHVEAGLRSFNMRMPEEVNRILSDRISTWLFTPTDLAAEHLRSEGVAVERIIPVGDVMYDVALQHGERVREQGGAMDRLGIRARQYVLATIHRAENTDDSSRLLAIFAALNELSKTIPVVWPLHPRTRAALGSRLNSGVSANLLITEPVGYTDMVQLEKYASVIATDSGGVQKEAFFHRVPCVTLRDETEWVELVDAGWNRLVQPTDSKLICDAIRGAIGTRGRKISPYGNGDAARRIVTHLLKAEPR